MEYYNLVLNFLPEISAVIYIAVSIVVVVHVAKEPGKSE